IEFFTCSTGTKINRIDFETGSIIASFKILKYFFFLKSNEISSLLYLNEKMLITSCENGDINIIDPNTSKIINIIKTSQDICTIICDNDLKKLIFSSGLGQVHAYSTNKWKLIDTSDKQDDEYTCSALFQNKSKILFGSSNPNGRFCSYNIGEWGNPTECIYTGTNSIDHLVSFDDKTLIFASSDGFV
ncbi:hypothetical protein MXB_5035, partial [Myxobolus squamalis]